MASDVVLPVDLAGLDRAVTELAENVDRWARLAVADRRRYLAAARDATLEVMDRWVELSLAAKRIPAGSHWAGAEWGSGPQYFLRALAGLDSTLAQLENGEEISVPRVSTRPDGRVVAGVYPETLLDRALTGPLSAEVWMERGVTEESLADTMALPYRGTAPEGRVALVLGAGNVASLGLWDLLHKLYLEGQVVALKVNPVVEYLTPVLEAVLAPWIADGFVRLVCGGADVGAYLVEHPGIDELHLTGGIATHDAIVFGTGDQGAKRKAEQRPRIDKPLTSELGGVSPVIVLPGPWSRADIATQADRIVGMKLNNNGHNCMSPQVLVLPAGWAPGAALVEEIERLLRTLPPQHAYYPGTAERQRTWRDAHPEAIELGGGNVPRTLLRDLDPGAEDEVAFTTEAFGPMLAQTSLPAPTPQAYLDAAVAFANDRLFGTLAATLLIHPETERQLGDALDDAIDRLRYGAVGVNEWHLWAAVFSPCPWGGAPGQPLHDVQSGRGFVHNSLMFDRPEKTVIRNTFHLAPQAWRYGHAQMSNRPLISANHPLGPAAGRAFTQMTTDPRWRRLPGLLTALLRGG